MTDPMTSESGRWLAEATANLDAYIEDRAQTKAEAALARTKLEAAEQLKTVRQKAEAEQRRQEDLITELRRQMTTCHKIIDRQGERRTELAAVLGVPAGTPWELLIAKVRKQATELNGVKQ